MFRGNLQGYLVSGPEKIGESAYAAAVREAKRTIDMIKSLEFNKDNILRFDSAQIEFLAQYDISGGSDMSEVDELVAAFGSLAPEKVVNELVELWNAPFDFVDVISGMHLGQRILFTGAITHGDEPYNPAYKILDTAYKLGCLFEVLELVSY